MPTILVSLSAHGFGHAAMTAPIINKIKSLNDDFRVVIYSSVPEKWLRTRINYGFDIIENKYDFGLVMDSAIAVDRKASQAAYRELHLNLEEKIGEQASTIKKVNPDIVLSNISYLTLAASRRLNIPSVALSSLNWLEIYSAYLDGDECSPKIKSEMLDAYRSATEFLIFSPGLPMVGISNTRSLGPSARIGTNRRDELEILAPGKHIGLVAYGGIATRLPVEKWPIVQGWAFLVPPEWGLDSERFIPWNKVPLPFVDLIASVDAVITKPGYGTFTEAACNGTAVLTQERPDWPETPYFENWMKANARFLSVPPELILTGAIAQPLARLLTQSKPARPKPDGVDQAADIIMKLINKQR